MQEEEKSPKENNVTQSKNCLHLLQDMKN